MPEIGAREKISALVKMFIFTLQSSKLSVCVGLRSTDLVMNNLLHTGNTLWKTQQSSVETLQSSDCGVSNYNFTTLWSSKRSTVSTTPPHPPPPFFSEDVTFICWCQLHGHKSSLFMLWKTQPRDLLNHFCKVAQLCVYIRTCYPGLLVCYNSVTKRPFK